MDAPEQNQTEQPTPYKLDRARRKGSVARGADLGFMSALAALLGYFWFFGASLVGRIEHAAAQSLVAATTLPIGADVLTEASGRTLMAAGKPLLIMTAIAFVAVLAFELVQTGVVFATETLKPDFSRLNPARGFKRVFSVRTLVESGKTILKLLIYTGIAILLVTFAITHVASDAVDAPSLANALARMGGRLVAMIVVASVAFAVLDQLIVRRDFLKRMRMSRREIRRETRDREGDARMKQRRKRLHAEFVKQSQSLRNIRGADILITNPTHYAVALRYDRKTMIAPAVVSLGADRLALRLKKLAFVYGVVIIEQPLLAKALYHGGRLNRQIPEGLFRSVADLYIANRHVLVKRGDKVQ